MLSAASDRRYFGPEKLGLRISPDEVGEAEASGAVARVYRDIREVGGYATVPLLYRRLATRPDCLEWAWRLLSQGYATGEIQRVGDQLKVTVDKVAPLSKVVLDAQGVTGDQARMAREIALAFNSANPRNLIAAHLMDAAARSGTRPHWGEGGPSQFDVPAEPYKSYLPEPVRPEDMSPEDRELLAWLSSSGGRSPTVLAPTLYRILANLPALLTLIACRLGPIFADGSIDQMASELEASAAQCSGQLAGMSHSRAECPDVDFVSEVVKPFRTKIAEMLVVGAMIEAFVREAADA